MNSRDNYFYPEYVLKVADKVYTEGLSLDYYSAKKQACDWVHIRFTDKLHKAMNLEPMQKISLEFGYSGETELLFSGYVDRVGQSENEVICKDAMLKLHKKSLCELFLAVNQAEYIQTLLGQAGVAIGEIKAPGVYRRDKVMIENISYAQALVRANTIWNTDLFYYFDAKEKFYFNAPKPQKKQYEFKYGESILNCTKHQGLFEIEVIPVPIAYTNLISVEHPSCSGIFEVVEVRFHVNDRGFPKMFLYFEG